MYVCTFLDVYFTIEEKIIPITGFYLRPINSELLGMGPGSLYFKQDSQMNLKYIKVVNHCLMEKLSLKYNKGS